MAAAPAQARPLLRRAVPGALACLLAAGVGIPASADTPPSIDTPPSASSDDDTGEAADDAAPEASEPFFPFDGALVVNGYTLGTLMMEASLSGQARVDLDSLVALVSDTASDGQIARLRDSGSGFVDVDLLRAAGFDIAYDPASLEVGMILPADGVVRRSLSARDVASLDLADAAPASSVSAMLSGVVRPRYVHRAPGRSPGFAPTTANLRGFANVGGFGGVSAVWELDAVEGRDGVWERGEVALIHDDFPRAIRYQLGDVRSRSDTFQTGASLLGLSVSREYGKIHPFRNLRPGGRTTFELDQPARVNFEVNGAVVRSERLPPGTYDVADFPLVNGLNDVRITVEDDFGTREVGAYSTFVDTVLLGRGLTRFSLQGGVQQLPGRDGFHPRYGDDLVGLASIEHGVSDRLTLGASVEASGELGFAGAGVVAALGESVLSVDAAMSAASGLPTGWAGAARWSLDRDVVPREGYLLGDSPGWGLRRWSLDVQAEHRTDSLASHGSFGRPLGERTLVAARGSAQFRDFNLSTSAGWRRSRGSERIEISPTIGFAFQGLSASLGLRAEHDLLADRTDLSGFLTLGKRLGGNDALRSRTRFGPWEQELEWRHISEREIGAWAARASYLVGEDGDELDAEATWITPLAEFDIAHNTLAGPGFGGARSSETEARIGMGIGFAGGRLAVGRPVGDSFAVVDLHPSLRGERAWVEQRSGRRIGGLGTLSRTLVPLHNPYMPATLRYNVPDLPPTQSLGEGGSRVVPGMGTGYALRIGTDPTAMVVGRLTDPSGEGIPLSVGELVGESGRSWTYFTNRNGRFVVEGVPPGTYTLRPRGRAPDLPPLVVDVALDSTGRAMLGDIALEAQP